GANGNLLFGSKKTDSYESFNSGYFSPNDSTLIRELNRITETKITEGQTGFGISLDLKYSITNRFSVISGIDFQFMRLRSKSDYNYEKLGIFDTVRVVPISPGSFGGTPLIIEGRYPEISDWKKHEIGMISIPLGIEYSFLNGRFNLSGGLNIQHLVFSKVTRELVRVVPIEERPGYAVFQKQESNSYLTDSEIKNQLGFFVGCNVSVYKEIRANLAYSNSFTSFESPSNSTVPLIQSLRFGVSVPIGKFQKSPNLTE
ncbi:MAG TPA: hypothetical protein PKC40_10180, partial [Saprospiraceae bacterium]|nr:hypothetical protein [Saprospiraceae bacterium]